MTEIVPVKIGIVGLGFGLQYMQHHIGDEGAYLSINAVCDAQPSRLAAGRAAFACQGYDDLDHMLAEADIEAVALFSGPVRRAQTIRKIIRAGKHVMTTKPFELDPDAAASVLQEARQAGRIVQLNSPSIVPGSDIEVIQRWQREYELGELVFALTDCWYPSLEKADGSWYDDPALCPVAPIFRLGIYGINDLLALRNDPAEVSVLQSRMRTGRPTPDVAQLSIRFAGGAIATVRAGWRCSPPRGVQSSEFVFERGAIRRGYDNPIEAEAHNALLTLEQVKNHQCVRTTASLPLGRTGHSYRWDLFHHALRGGTVANAIVPERIVAGVKLIRAMTESQKTGRSVCL